MGSTAEDNGVAQRHIDDHLDRIEAVLQGGGMSRGERQHILDDVQTQIHDMLAERCQGTPTVDDVCAVLAELDPPENYAQEAEPVPPVHSSETQAGPRKKRLGNIALACFACAFLALAAQPILMWAMHRGFSEPGVSHGPRFHPAPFNVYGYLLLLVAAFYLG